MDDPKVSSDDETTRLFVAAGVEVTERARARTRLASARARWTPERWSELG